MGERLQNRAGGGGGLTALRRAYAAELSAQRLAKTTIYRRLAMFDRLGDPRSATKADVLAILEGVDAGTRKSYLSIIRRVFADLIFMDEMDADPSSKVRSAKGKTYEPRPITEDELAAILGINPRIRAWAILGAYAGLRRCEVVQVEREHLLDDERGPTLLVPNGKGGTHLTIPAHPLVVDVLQAARPGRLWPISVDTFTDAWAYHLRRAGLGHCTFHRLRHRFATQVYRSTGDLLVTSKVCRHRSLTTTQVYSRVADRRPYEAVLAI
jgi:integrase